MLDTYLPLIPIRLAICRPHHIMTLESPKYWSLDLRMYNIVAFERPNTSSIIISFIWFEAGIDKSVWIAEI